MPGCRTTHRCCSTSAPRRLTGVSRPLVVALILVLALAATGCGSDTEGGGGGGTTLKAGDVVSMKSLRFHPDHVQVKVGQAVTWRNDEGVPHNVVANSGADFESKTFGKNGTFSFTPGNAPPPGQDRAHGVLVADRLLGAEDLGERGQQRRMAPAVRDHRIVGAVV